MMLVHAWSLKKLINSILGARMHPINSERWVAAHMNARDGLPLLGLPRGGVGGRSSLMDCSNSNSDKLFTMALPSACI